MDYEAELTRPNKLWSRSEIMASPCPVPATRGVYAWYFAAPPPDVPTLGCVTSEDATLLYVGISPRHPPANGKPPSSQTLRSRIRYHYGGNAEGSTLRLTLGCLLADSLGLRLRRVGSGTRLTLGVAGEAALSEWMGRSALVCWVEHLQPWLLEQAVINTVSLPLNLDQNRGHEFHSQLSLIRAEAKRSARAGPIDP